MSKTIKLIEYIYRGKVERWAPYKRSYVWHHGYSQNGENGGALYPWMTKRECEIDAKKQGGRAVFVKVSVHHA